MPVNKFFLYMESLGRVKVAERKAYVADTTHAISMALSGKGLDKYIKALDGKDG